MADANRPPPLPVLPSIFTQRRRVIVACTTCRKRKVKCLASENPPRSPCKRCLEKGIACEYGTVGEDKTTRSQQLEQVSESPAYASRWAPQNLPTQLASSHSHARPGSGPFPPAYLESHSHSNPGPSNSQYLYPHYASQSGSNSYRSSPRPAHVQSESNLWETAPMQSPKISGTHRGGGVTWHPMYCLNARTVACVRSAPAPAVGETTEPMKRFLPVPAYSV
ncbi:hypothetical protein FB451DRAFT_1401684 [Mycena latifolia]|nr:hypothetical protein FB451DRAFT_1401684 [Mycena latifolia]